MSKIPTAVEFLSTENLRKHFNTDNPFITDMLIEFAKLHVTAALSAASESVLITSDFREPAREQFSPSGEHYSNDVYRIDEDSILSAYPLENIK
jgi:hypothetical protein